MRTTKTSNGSPVRFWPAPGTGSTVAEATWTLSYSLIRLGRYDEALDVVGEGAGRVISDGWRARSQALRAVVLVDMRRDVEAEEAGRSALAAAELAGDDLARGYAQHALSVVAFMPADYRAALSFIDAALAAIGEDAQAADLRLMLLGIGRPR